ncbi:MAG TPA: class IV adenylate cyclase [Steroidobacteraceae bacterium]|nr:class IV adenylate cyclase [Steroidobacteraceae bacterium]
MSRNIEIKAHAPDLSQIESRARALADQGPFDLTQDDTFFGCAHGRLKLRELAPDHGELIFYQRPDVPGPKLSEYTLAATSTPASMRAALAGALGVVGRVRKRRRLYLAGQTRIHLDQVEGLGTFMELEVVLTDSQTAAEGEAIAERLLEQLGIRKTDLVSGAYIDHIEQGGAPRGGVARDVR